MNLEHRLAKTKTALVLEHPFIGTIALQKLKFHIAGPEFFESIGGPPTAAVSDKDAYFCDEFIEDLSDDELKFLVAHECMHPMLEHNWRRGERDARTWNHAADYVINKLLHDEGIGRMPEGGLHDDSIYQSGGGTSEGIYSQIYAKEEGSDGQPGNGNGQGQGQGQAPGQGSGDFDTIMEPEGSPAEKEQQAQEWRIAVAQAAQAAKMMGKMSGNMQRLVDEILNPVVDWRDVLNRFLEKCRNDSRSFARPNRRFITQGLYLPSPDGEAMGEIAWGVDCSGSIGQEEINQYAAEIRAVKDELNPSKMHVIYFDSRVSHVDTFGRDEEVVIEPHGGGGTAFSPVFDYIEEHGINPVACVFLTDLYCSDFGEDPGYPVLWVSTGRDEAPFGEVVPFS